MRGLPFPGRLQLAKLLRGRGLRELERRRGDEVRAALARLAALNERESTMHEPPSSTQLMRAQAPHPAAPEPALAAIDDHGLDDPHALPRFREPRVALPDADRTFLRTIAVKPGLLFFTWDVAHAERAALRAGVELWIHARDFLGAPPTAAELLADEPLQRHPVELSSTGWYAPLEAERAAVVAVLVEVAAGPRRIAVSNVALCPPSRPAPPGPLWLATLPPLVDRRLLGKGVLLRALQGGTLPEGAVVVEEGISEAEHWADTDVPSSSAVARSRAQRLAMMRAHPSVSSTAAEAAGLPSSGVLPSSHAFRSGGVS